MRNNTPSKDSIYYNALPFHQDRLDLSEIREMYGSEFESWFKDIWSEQAKDILINASTIHLYKLRRLYFQARNFEKTRGPKSLAIGFPVVVDTNESDLVFAPVFLQNVWLEPVMGNQHHWKIIFSPGVHLQPNYRLLRHLKLKYGFDFKQEAERVANDASISKIEAFCANLGAKLHLEPKPFDTLESCPGLDEIGQQSEQGALVWTAVLALFPPQDSGEHAPKVKPEEKFKPTPIEPSSNVPVPLSKEDLETANALQEIAKNKVVVVKELQYGTHQDLVVNLLINALANGNRCLVVSPFSPSLRKTSENLSKKGLLQLQYVLDDAVNDSIPFLDLVRSVGSGSRKEVDFDEKGYEVAKGLYRRASQELSLQFDAARKPVFGQYSWSEVVGLWIKESRIAKQDLLGSHLSPRDFAFDHEEFEKLGESVAICQELFHAVNTLNHPLTVLNAQLFTDLNVDQSLNYVSGKVQEKLEEGAQLQKEIIGAITGYAQALRNKLDGIYRRQLKEANQLLKTHESFIDRYGESYLNATSRPGSFSLFLSKKKKEVAEAMDVTAKLYKLFVRHFNEQRLIEFDFPGCNSGYHTDCVGKNIRACVDALKQWHKSLDDHVKDHTLRLNHKTADPTLDLTGMIRSVEEKLEHFIARLNEDELFQQAFENKTLTLPQRQKYLEYILDSLESVKMSLRDFKSFYTWQRQWLSLPENEKKLIGAIVKSKPSDWGAAFRMWYLNHVLIQNASEHQPAGDLQLGDVSDAWSVLKEMLVPAILNHWHGVQEEQKKRLRKSNSTYHKLIFGRKKAATKKVPDLGTFFNAAFECLTAYFPVLMVTPHVARNILQSSAAEKFDHVLYLDGDRFPIEDAALISELGKQLIIIGRKEDLGTESSLINYAIDNEVPMVELDGHLKRVSQSIFREGNVLKVPHIKASYVSGRFDDLESTNLVEAQQVVRLLNQAKPNEKRVFPSIGVITFTQEQRDLIQTQLLKLKQENSLGSEKILQLERNGLGVFCLEELYGQSFDELIVSCSFGPVDGAGTLTRKLAFLNTVNNVQALRCLIAQRANQITIVHSLSDKIIQGARASDSEPGLNLLANLLALADAQASEDQDFIKEVQVKLGVVLPANTHQSVFLKEVRQRLGAYIDADDIAFASMPPGLHKPLFVKPSIVVQQDGFFSKMPTTFGPWEEAIQNEVRKMGMEVRAEWASNWFQDPRLHERQLASFILKRLDSERETAKKD